MLIAIFGIDGGAISLVINLLVLFLVVIYLALIYWTYLDAKRRIEDPVLIACATAASVFPFIGTVVYTILRPPEFLEDREERELELRAAELRLRQLIEQSCPHCEYPIERNYLRCPNCERTPAQPLPQVPQAARPEVGHLPLLRDRGAAPARADRTSTRPSAGAEPARASAARRRASAQQRPSGPAEQARRAIRLPLGRPADRAPATAQRARRQRPTASASAAPASRAAPSGGARGGSRALSQQLR